MIKRYNQFVNEELDAETYLSAAEKLFIPNKGSI